MSFRISLKCGICRTSQSQDQMAVFDETLCIDCVVRKGRCYICNGPKDERGSSKGVCRSCWNQYPKCQLCGGRGRISRGAPLNTCYLCLAECSRKKRQRIPSSKSADLISEQPKKRMRGKEGLPKAPKKKVPTKEKEQRKEVVQEKSSPKKRRKGNHSSNHAMKKTEEGRTKSLELIKQIVPLLEGTATSIAHPRGYCHLQKAYKNLEEISPMLDEFKKIGHEVCHVYFEEEANSSILVDE